MKFGVSKVTGAPDDSLLLTNITAAQGSNDAVMMSYSSGNVANHA